MASGSSVFEVNIRTGTLTDVREKVLDLSFRPDMSHAHVSVEPLFLPVFVEEECVI